MAKIFEKISDKNHEQVVYCNDPSSGLKAIIAVHNTVLGPALGGCRMYPYKSEEDALVDVLRLSRGMTYKASISNLNLGGGKAVIIGDPNSDKSEVLLRSFGKFVQSLGGKYITAEDVGMTVHDMEFIRMETDHVTGIPVEMGGSGDPSPFTAYGVYIGMKASAKFKWGSDDLNGKRVVVQGIGHVGENLVKYLTEERATVIINDINEARLQDVSEMYGSEIIMGDAIYDTEMDIYAPCALGATVNDDTLSRLKCSIISGAANNQLEDEKVNGEAVKSRGIVYAPDFLINAGGLINVYSELHGYDREKALQRIRKIYDTTLEILVKSEQEDITTHEAALRMAEQRIANAQA